jgi:hypothetical protein
VEHARGWRYSSAAHIRPWIKSLAQKKGNKTGGGRGEGRRKKEGKREENTEPGSSLHVPPLGTTTDVHKSIRAGH